MASSALIDDLLKQFAENPRRVFARLANEYRKNGELDTAIEICRAHVPLQPTYISGYIVLGQALYESTQLDEARTTFETALGLDPENLIALRQLGDIARANGDIAGARAWYRRLLEVDPQNDEIAAQLQELDSPAGSAPAAASAPAETTDVSWSDIHPEHTARATEPEAAAAGVPEPVGDAAPPAEQPKALDFDFDVLSDFSTEDQPAAASTMPEPVAEIDAMSFGEVFLPERDDAGAVEEEPALGHDERAHATVEPEPAEREAEPVSAPQLEQAAAPEPVAATPEAVPAPEPVAAMPEAEPEPVAGATVEREPAAETDEPLPAAFITETMAELYLQQGHREQALDIYRLLVAQRPGDLSLLNRIARLERTAPPAPPERTIRAFFGRFARRRPPGESPIGAAEPVAASGWSPEDAPQAQAEPEPEPAVEDTSFASAEPSIDVFAMTETEAVAQPAPPIEVPASEEPDPSIPMMEQGPPAASVPERAASFAEMFAGRLVSSADEQAASTLAGAFAAESMPTNGGGHPARAAAEALSLDDVFGGGATDHDQGHVSFDEFFAPPNGAQSAPQPAENAPPAPAPQRGDDADLELFHAWLEGLKK